MKHNDQDSKLISDLLILLSYCYSSYHLDILNMNLLLKVVVQENKDWDHIVVQTDF